MLLKSPLQVGSAADIKLSRSIFQDIDPERMRRVTQTPRVGFEPTTDRLIPARRDSTIEQLLADPAGGFHGFDLPLAAYRGRP